MAAPMERSGFEDARHAGRLRRSVFIGRRARAGRMAEGGGGRIRIGLMMIVPLLLLPFAAAAAVVIGATRFYDNAVADLNTPANMLAAVANYGGAQIYDRNGVLLYRFPESDGGFRFPARLDGVSKAMIDATVSTEDQNFWNSNGVDYTSTLGAAYENFRATGNPFSGRGASGITQQLVKQTLITPEDRAAQSVSRKLQEAIYATEVANHYSKEQILEWYLNVINYGGVYNGVETAAQGYFGVHASELTLAQAAMLAGIPQSPALHSPYASWEGAKWRQGEVLDLMVMHHYITQAEADAAKREHIELKAREEALPLRAPWFVEYVRQELVARFGERCVQRCGLAVTTTLDVALQDQAQAILEKNLTKHADPIGAHNGSMVSIDARTGEILLMVGSRNYDDTSPEIRGSNNFATSILQPGSSFKPFVYLTLFMKQGYGPSSIIWDEPFVTSDGYKCENPGAGNRTYGPVPIKIALGSSLNCPANRAAAVAGIGNVIDTAKKMGITTLDDPSNYGPSIATGGANITLLEMAYAYTTLARDGSMVGAPSIQQAGTRPLDPVSLRKVTDATGRTLLDFKPQDQRVVPAGYTSLVTSILSDCSTRRLIWDCSFPTFRMSDGRPVAAKTGTQQGDTLKVSNANWLFLYTPQLVTGGWVGNANRAGWTDPNGASNAIGYSVQEVEDTILKSYKIPPAPFERSSDIVEVSVRVPDGTRGLLANCGPLEKGLFVRGTAPDVNNRVCVNGVLMLPKEQADSGGLRAWAMPTATPAAPVGAITSPGAGANVSGGLLILARGPQDKKVELQWGVGTSPVAWSSLTTTSLTAGEYYAGWETSSLAAGPYSIRLMIDGKLASMIAVQVGRSTIPVPVPTPTVPPSATPTPRPSVTPQPTATPLPGTPVPTATTSRTTQEPTPTTSPVPQSAPITATPSSTPTPAPSATPAPAP